MSLIINKLRIEGKNYRRTLSFDNSLNIIAGDIYSGKSLILRLIDYSLGKSQISLEAQKELKGSCDEVYLEININNSLYTIKRNLKSNTSKFYIYFTNLNNIGNFTPKVLTADEYSKFLLNLLNIPQYKLLKHRANSKSKTTEIISIRDVFRFCYIPQHDFGTNNFLAQNDINKFRKNKPTLDLILDLIIDDKKGIKDLVMQKTNEKIENEKMVDSLKTYISESDIEAIDMLFEKETIIKNELLGFIESKKEIKKTIITQKGDTNTMFTKLNHDLNDTIEKISLLDQEIKSINLDIASKNNLKHKFLQEINDVEMTREANFYLKESEQEVKCPLCNATHLNKAMSSSYDNESLNIIVKELQSKIFTLKSITEINLQKKFEKEKMIEYFNSRKNLIKSALTSYNDNLDIPMLSELEAIETMIYKCRQGLVELRENIKIHNKIREKESIVASLNKELEDLQIKLDNLFKNNEFRNTILDALNLNYINLIKEIGIPEKENGTCISKSDFIPYYDNASVYQHDSGGILASIQIAFLGALLKLTTDSKYKILHPNFLMLDTIGKYLGKNKGITFNDENIIIMDDNVYNNIYDTLITLSNHCQIIVVENTPRPCDGKYIKYIFTKQRIDNQNSSIGLIDFDKNEISINEFI